MAGSTSTSTTIAPSGWTRSARTSASSNPLRAGDVGIDSAVVNPGRPNPRVHEVWPQVGGHNRFLFRGYCITGPRIDFGYNFCAWSFIIVPSAFYFIVCSQWLWIHIHPLLPILTAAIFASTVIFLLLTSCSDPGIIPRHSLQVIVPGLEEEVATATGASAVCVDMATAEPVCELTEEQDRLGYRWCPSCKVIRPPRASHCRDCDNCVLTFDHHCPFVNNCVGQRNYAFFSAFLVSTGCLGFAVAAGMGIYFSHVASENHNGQPFLSHTMLYLILAVIGAPTCILLIGVLGLSMFHSWLACRGRTTKEVLTGRVTVRGRTLSTFRGPSLLHARDRVSYPMAVV